MFRLASITTLIVLIALAPLPIGRVAQAQDAAASASDTAAGAKNDNATPVSELDVVAKPKPAPTPLEGLDVVAPRKHVTEVAGVEVTGPRTCLPPRSPADQDVPAPKLVSTYPANGQTVQPGYAVLRLTFDLPMACRGSLPQNLLAACFSGGVEIWHESFDRRSLMIACDLKPNSHYELDISRHPAGTRRLSEPFQGLSGREPEDALFSFDTSGDPPVTTAEAMIQRDGQLVAMLQAVGRNPELAAASAPEAAAPAPNTKVSILQVQGTNRCLPPRDPPDPEVPAPKLVSTFPAQGQAVRPGLLEVRFTFDLPMACTGAVTVKAGDRNPCLDLGTEHWTQPWDRHSMRFRCRVEPGKRYDLFINTAFPGQPRSDFQGLGGKTAEPYKLTFTTSQDAPVQTEPEADDQDPLIADLLEGQPAKRAR